MTLEASYGITSAGVAGIVVQALATTDFQAVLKDTEDVVRATAGDFDEGRLLRKALAHSVSRFRHDCAHERHVADAQQWQKRLTGELVSLLDKTARN